MNREEIIEEIARLNKQLEEMDKPVGYKDDNIFLLSIEEYTRYKNAIPKVNMWSWLRSPGSDDYFAAYVDSSGNVIAYGDYVNNDRMGIRPVMKLIGWDDASIETKFSYGSYSFTIIDKNLAIATVPITFDKFDDESNNYENSYIRKWLLEWERDGKNDIN